MKRGFTLIELLIVVAIVAISSVAMIAWLVVPGREQLQATGDMAMENGAGVLFARLVGEAHAATTFSATGDPAVLRFDGATSGSGAMFFVDAEGTLRFARTGGTGQGAAASSGTLQMGQSVPLLERVTLFTAEPLTTAPLWRVSVAVGTTDPLHPTVARSMELAMPAQGAQ